eukprot:TRINITY_DN8327_c0_g1_i1.p1 TRINITY_DN8327_c0_g1~~TRINITY_DN8327_c0_g1_i1.p1  ORF type:complete len:316 (+),score=33.85 TRINITY_DN8327_c0_g1_i1:38-985(+)
MHSSLAVMVMLFATVAGTEFVNKECEKKGIQTTVNQTGFSLLNYCRFEKIRVDDYSCGNGDCTITDQEVRSSGAVSGFGGNFRGENGVIAYTTATDLHVRILGIGWFSEPVSEAVNVHAVSVVEKAERTFLICWGETVLPQTFYKLVRYTVGGTALEEDFRRGADDLGSAKVVYIKAHNSFFVVAKKFLGSSVVHLVGLLIDADTGVTTTTIVISSDPSFVLGWDDITVLSDGVTVGISSVSPGNRSWREVFTAVRVVSPNYIDQSFEESSTDYDADPNGRFDLSGFSCVQCQFRGIGIRRDKNWNGYLHGIHRW